MRQVGTRKTSVAAVEMCNRHGRHRKPGQVDCPSGRLTRGSEPIGAPGVDGCSLEKFEDDPKNNLYRIWNRMSSGSYFPPPVLAVEIPKPNGGEQGCSACPPSRTESPKRSWPGGWRRRSNRSSTPTPTTTGRVGRRWTRWRHAGSAAGLAEQRERLKAQRVLDQRGLVQVLGAENRLEPVGFGVDAALPASASQQRPQLGRGELRGRAGGVSGGEDGAGVGAQQAVAFVGEPRDDPPGVSHLCGVLPGPQVVATWLAWPQPGSGGAHPGPSLRARRHRADHRTGLFRQSARCYALRDYFD
jgi:hypothetical protein